MRHAAPFVMALMMSTPSIAETLTFSFNSPAFNGAGYSSHALTIYQLEQAAKQRQEDRRRQEIAAALRAEQNSPGNQFMQAFQSLVYAQLAKNLSDQLFGENPQNNGNMSFSNVTIAWIRTGSDVTMTITDRATNSTTTITVPIGAFAF
jgi:curli production assembly/transport component CsgF